MGAPKTMDVLRDRASMMRESLQKSQNITNNMVSILGSFDHRLSALETAMRPTQLRTHSIRRAHENIDKTLKSAEIILAQFDRSRQAEAKILKGPHEDLESYLEAIDQLRSIVQFFSSNKSFKSSHGVLNHANNLLTKAISKLEDEFRQLLSSHSKPVEPDLIFDCVPDSLRPLSGLGNQGDSLNKTTSKNCHEQQKKSLENEVFKMPTLISPRILPLLQNLAQQMISAGHKQQLFKIYREIRGFALEQSLRKLGVEKHSKDDFQRMQWEVLESKIRNWIYFMQVSVKVLFPGEKKICDQILSGSNSLREQSFAEITSSSVATLLSFGDGVARSKRSPEKLFVLLDMYELMKKLYRDIETIFESKACFEVREQAMSLTKRLAQTAHETFADFEDAIEKDVSKTNVLDGTVHPLTHYVINYLRFFLDYHSVLKLFLKEFNESDPDSQLASATTRVMQALQANLDGKSKQYKDPALTQLFLMNNIHYIVRSVRKSVAKDFLDDDWVQIHRRIVQQHANQYKRISWAKILQGLTVQGGGSSSGGRPTASEMSASSGLSRPVVKERFKTFNIQFEELHQRQSQWNVPDSELRESLRLAVAEVLLPAYRSFVKRFGPMIENGKNPQKYIKYTPEDLERMLGEFFEGKIWN